MELQSQDTLQLSSAVLFLGGIQLVCLGIIGEYIGRIYYETKKRPHYLIKQTNMEKEENMRYINHEYSRFIVVGGINTVHYYIFYLLCLQLLHFHYFLSHALGFAISLVGSFFLNTYFTYKVKPTLAKFIRFPLTQVVKVSLLSTILLFVLIEWFGSIVTLPHSYQYLYRSNYIYYYRENFKTITENH